MNGGEVKTGRVERVDDVLKVFDEHFKHRPYASALGYHLKRLHAAIDYERKFALKRIHDTEAELNELKRRYALETAKPDAEWDGLLKIADYFDKKLSPDEGKLLRKAFSRICAATKADDELNGIKIRCVKARNEAEDYAVQAEGGNTAQIRNLIVDVVTFIENNKDFSVGNTKNGGEKR